MKSIRLIIFLLLSTPCFSQDMMTWEYNLTHGLPSTTCYALMESKSGEIWFGSDHGVTRFNGQTFTTYTVEDGLNENTVLNCFEDSYGRIWFHHGEKFPSYFYNGKIYNTKGKKNQIVHRLSLFAQTKDGTIIVGGYDGYYCFDKNGISSFVKTLVNTHFVVSIKVDGVIYVNSNSLLSDSLILHGSKVKQIKPTQFQDLGRHQLNFSTQIRSYDFLFEKWDDSSFKSIFNDFQFGSIYDLKEIGEFLYFATNDGLFQFRKENGTWVINHRSYKGETIVSILPKNNCLFLSIWGKGIIQHKRLGLNQKKHFLTEETRFLKATKDGLYFSDYTSNLYKLNKDGTKEIYWLDFNKNKENPIYDIYETKDSIIVLSHIGLFSINRATKKSNELSTPPLLQVVYLSNSDEFVFSTGQLGLAFFSRKNNTQSLQIRSDFMALSRVRDMAYFRGQLYVATSKGLWKYLNGEISKVKPDVFGNLQINSLHVHGNNLLIGTNGNGLWAYDLISLERLELNNSIDINQVLNIKPSLGETFWVLTNGALQKFYLDGKELLQIQALDLRSQIKSSEVTYMAEHNNELYILSKDGIYAFPAGSSKALEALKIVPLSLKVDNHLTSTKRIILINEEQSLHFKFAAVNFSKHASKLSYRVNKGDWIETKDGNVFLTFNESGEYQLEVKGSSNFYKNSVPLVYTISVDGDFEWVLLVAFILALGVIVYLIFKLRNQVRFSPK